MPEFQEEFDRGLEAARDEAGTAALDSSETARTTLRSTWFHSVCSRCSHTFRVNDVVRRVNGELVHSGGELNCATEQRSTFDVTPAVREFFAGLDEEWPPPVDVEVTRLEPGHRLLAPPVGAIRRRTCFVCTHTFRSLDQIVICPCSPSEPLCEVGVHRDPVHGLLCLETWNPGGSRTHCPVTSRKLDK